MIAGALGVAAATVLALNGPVSNASAAKTTKTTKTTAAAQAKAAAVSWPKSSSRKKVTSTIKVTNLDGNMTEYYGIGNGSQSESQAPMFEVADGGVIKNVIISPPAGDGIHCLGSCTIQNVWWTDVGEDAASFKGKGKNNRIQISGGGAKLASDKVFQFNSGGTLTVENFYVEDFGKLVRNCGNCSSQFKRDVTLRNITAKAPGKVLVGVNDNYGDKATISGITLIGDSKKKIKICATFHDNGKGKEPKQVSSGPSANCSYSSSAITYQ